MTLSSQTTLRTLQRSTMSASTVALELTHQAVDDLNKRIIPWNKIRRGPPPCLAYVATVGVGKTGAIVRVVEEALAKQLRVAIRIPTLQLGSEILARLENKVPGAAGIWYGREQEDPKSPGRTMCLRAEDTKAAQAVGGDPNDVCGSKKRGYCPHHPNSDMGDPCGYMGQNLTQKQVVIFCGDAMLQLSPRKGKKRAKSWQPYEPNPTSSQSGAQTQKSKNGAGKRVSNQYSGEPDFDLLILDESDPFSFLDGFQSPPVSFSETTSKPILAEIKDQSDQEILAGFTSTLFEALSGAKSGNYLGPLKIGEYYLDDFMVGNCIDHTETRRNNTNVPGFIDILMTVREVAYENLPKPAEQSHFCKLSASQIREANISAVQKRKFFLGIAHVCEAMCVGLSNDLQTLRHLKIESVSGDLFIRRKKELSAVYRKTPTMIFDATLRPELLQTTFKNLEMSFECLVKDADGVQRFQLRDQDLSYGKVKSSGWSARLLLFGMLCTRMYGNTGLILPKKVREQLPEADLMDIKLGHFGALRGLNTFENLPAIVVASRTAIDPRLAEDMAGVLFGQKVFGLSENETWYPKSSATIRWRENPSAGWTTNYVRHPDSAVESVRAGITEDTLEQALGRGRNVRRALKRPLTEYILTTTQTDRPVDGTFTMAEFKAATGWVGTFLESGFWVPSGEKGTGAIIHTLVCALKSQRPDSLLINLISNPAFEGPESAADWRKQQLYDNLEIQQLVAKIDQTLDVGEDSIEILYGHYPLDDFLPIRAKVRGARYFAQVYVRVAPGQTAEEALRAVLGPYSEDVEIEG